jgi:hypothetical protein
VVGEICRMLGFLLMLPLGVLHAQERIEGVVRDSASGAPIAGAVVTISDSAGQARRQILTDVNGRFSVTVTSAWPDLRVIKIGFTPVELTGDTWRGNRTLNIRMAPFAFTLEAVKSTTSSKCQGNQDNGKAAAALWVQARSALLATVVARRSLPATATVAEYRRVFDTTGVRLLGQSVHGDSGEARRPFGAVASAHILAGTGYVLDHDDMRQFLAPDADVMLDPAFARGHCFGVVVGTDAHQGDVGLTFRPAEHSNAAVADITGTLWMTITQPQLRSLSFKYVNIEESVENAGAGGTLYYRTMGNGVVALTTWRLLLPAVAKFRVGWRAAPIVGGNPVVKVDDVGGVLVHGTWPDGSTYQAPLGTLLGRVVRGQFSNASPAACIRVWIDSTYYSATTDSLGTFRIRDVLPGRYTVRYRDLALTTFGARDEAIDVTVKPGDNALPLRRFSPLGGLRIARAHRGGSQASLSCSAP